MSLCEVCHENPARFVCSNCGAKVCPNCFVPSGWLCKNCYKAEVAEEPEALPLKYFFLPFALFIIAFALIFAGFALMTLSSPENCTSVVVVPPFFVATSEPWLALLLVVAFLLAMLVLVLVLTRIAEGFTKRS